MPKLSALKKGARKETVEGSVDYGGVTITFEFSPATLTGDVVQEFADNQEAPIKLAACLADTLTKWDLTDDKDKPLPLEATTIVTVPMGLMYAILGEMQNTSRPDPKAEATSFDT